jgi:hypothetical protein
MNIPAAHPNTLSAEMHLFLVINSFTLTSASGISMLKFNSCIKIRNMLFSADTKT